MSRFASLALLVAGLLVSGTFAQGEKTANPVAATVNGTAIPQASLDRALERFSDEERGKARTEILDFLIDNTLIDQYLLQQKITVDPKDVEARLGDIKKEIEKNGQTYAKVLASLKMSEEDFTAQVANDLRWEKFALSQSTDANLKALFEQQTDMFDGSMTRARHILLAADAKAPDAARAELLQIRKQIEARAAALAAKLPATADALTREQERQKQVEIAFSEIARDRSTCPSKKDGGDLNWFPRAGHMVEPFARAAFALKPYQMSEPIQTQFGWHLILCTGKKPGQAVKFEDVKEEVREIYCNRLRESISSQLRQSAKIVIAPSK